MGLEGVASGLLVGRTLPGSARESYELLWLILIDVRPREALELF